MKKFFLLIMAVALSQVSALSELISSSTMTPDSYESHSVEIDGTTLYFYRHSYPSNIAAITCTDTFWYKVTDEYYDTGYSGSVETDGENKYSGHIVVPPYVLLDEDSLKVVHIGPFAFSKSQITSIDIPETVESIREYAFYRCNTLTSINIPDSVVIINREAFRGCKSLTTVIIPEKVHTIDESAFGFCSNLTSIYFKGTEPPKSYIGDTAFTQVSPDCILYVPTGTKDLYVSALSDTFDSDHIVELSADQFPSALPTVTTTTKSVVGYYDLSGRKLTAPTGVTIIRYSDGTAEKILAK